MNSFTNKHERYRDYFDTIAIKRVKYRKRHAYYWNEITNYCNYFILPDASVAEIGCGTGEMLNQLNGNYKIGIDFSAKMIEIARKQYPAIEFHLMDAEQIDLNKKVDIVIISNLIGFLEDIEAVFCEIRKLCHSRTKVIVTYYNYIWEPILGFSELIGIKQKTPRQNWLSQRDIMNVLYLSGYDGFREIRRMLLPFNIPLISYLCNKFLVKLPFFNSLGLNQYVFARPLPESHDVNHKYRTSVIIPARNESGNIENAIVRLPKFGKSIEIIFIEGNSTDDTWQTIQDMQKKYQSTHTIKIAQQDGKGKYNAVKKGFAMATGDILMILDADLTVPPEDLPKFYDALASGKGEFINGTRLVYQLEKDSMRFLNILGNKFFSMVFTWLLGQPFKDTLCGTKVMFKSDYEHLEQNRKFFGDFDPFGHFDLIFGAYKLNLKIVELPIRYQSRTYGSTNISRFMHGFILLKMCLFAAKKIKFW